MSSEIGNKIKVNVFGESHGAAIGVVINGLPVGETIDLERLQKFMARRAPGTGAHTTSRVEADIVRVLAGLTDGKTNGAPFAAICENTNTRSGDYEDFINKPRPGHADYTAYIKYKGNNDIRGGGHFSGRLTAPLCIAGGICLQILERRGITLGAHIQSIAGVEDERLNMASPDMEKLVVALKNSIPTISRSAGERMLEVIAAAKAEGDSVGGIIECFAVGLPAGLGAPMFGGVENRIAAAIFGIPAVRGIEFGAGFAAAGMRGSEHNDTYIIDNEKIRTATNNHGGALGGITSGMPLVFRTVIKPTPSIAKEQDTISIKDSVPVKISVQGRHDPCIVPRAVPCVEAVTALTLLDMMEEGI